MATLFRSAFDNSGIGDRLFEGRGAEQSGTFHFMHLRSWHRFFLCVGFGEFAFVVKCLSRVLVVVDLRWLFVANCLKALLQFGKGKNLL